MIKKYNSKLATLITLCALSTTSAYAQDFNNIEWTLDTVNTPIQDRDGNGRTPSTSNATNNQDALYQFEISTVNTSELQRQEFQFQRRSGYHRFEGEFRISSEQPNFDRVSVAQTHDDQIRSEGVFSIYQVRRDNGDGYVFGVQGDTTEASNGYGTFDTVSIDLDRWYRLETRTYSVNRDDTFEIARLYEGDTLIWTETIEGGGEDEQYKKVGAYRLRNGTGRVIVDWTDLTFYTGEEI